MAKAFNIQVQEVLTQLEKMLNEQSTCPLCKAKKMLLLSQGKTVRKVD